MLEAKNALITGAGRGIGKAAALAMAREGAAVVVNDLDETAVRDTVDEIVNLGGKAVACPGNVTAPGFPEQFVGTAIDAYGGIDIVVNNAGDKWDSMLHKMTDEQWLAMLDIHVTAPFRIIRAASPFMREVAKREIAAGERVMRKVVNVSSVVGTCGNVGSANYAAGKAAVIGLTKTLAREWGPFNINCNALAFGWIETRLTLRSELQESRKEVEQAAPLRRLGATGEAASAILFLVSPMSDYVTGHVLHVDGGLDM